MVAVVRCRLVAELLLVVAWGLLALGLLTGL
jgi:hypothetical protein